MAFNKVGFFHFGKNHSQPLRELRSALLNENGGRPSSGKNGLNGSLIVLPEGFNIRKRYKEDRKRKSDNNPAILWDLRQLAAEFGVAFVAGLIVHQQDDIRPPYNSAYLVDGSAQVLMCRKLCEDGYDGQNYTPSTLADCDLHNPYVYMNEAVIGALICVDATPTHRPPIASHFPEHRRLERVMSRMDSLAVPIKVVCVPACISNNFGGGAPGNRLDFPCNNKVVVMANSDPFGQVQSFITDTRGEIIDSSVGGEENRVVVRPLASGNK